MAVPPCYSDLGKDASDLFSKGYNFGDVKLDVSTTSAGKTGFKAAATSHGDGPDGASRRVSGSLELKREVYKNESKDITVTSKWATDNTVNTTLTANNFGLENNKVTLEGFFVPHSGKHSGKVKGAYKRPHFHMTDEVQVKSEGVAVSATAVVKKCGFYAGYQGTYSQYHGGFKDSNFAVGFAAKDFSLHTTCINHGSHVHGSLFHSVSSKLDLGVALRWAAGADGAHFSIGSKYSCCPGTIIRSKFNSDGELGLSYKQELNSNVNVTLSAQVDTKALALPSHRLGLGLDFCA
ncbi:voltage-dependent anion-selective channel-like [Sycon ciliatum]|uniref:voltage-dependent anion-selective channel-like n=1 Tax=Sycon ciliatum TaxID=27933 RepID=UPI0020AC3120|eukprot:scpid68189/ scgid20093/ Voltage-dependent anion-selective channel; DmVDAC; Porin